jgi:uncharacterized protein YegJ (DUF2314 family)
MIEAMCLARQTFAEFRSNVEADWKRLIPIVQACMVKAYFANPEKPEEGEHLWIQYEGYSDDLINGTVLSEPDNLRKINQGDKVSFPTSRLSDWLYVENDTAHGAFTVQLLRKRMTSDERAQHDSAYPFKFINE